MISLELHAAAGRALLAFAMVATLEGHATAAAAEGNLLGDEILNQLLPGADVHFFVRGRHTRGWVSAKWRFNEDGTLAGNLFSSAWIAQPEPPESVDSGTWRVADDRLCVRWQHWGGGSERCYRIDRTGPDTYAASGPPGMFAGPFTLVR